MDSCFYLYVNGTLAAYSQVSHSTSEVDITRYLHDGENHLAVLALKWCDGSYLEDQDKFRMSGIFLSLIHILFLKTILMAGKASAEFLLRPFLKTVVS